MVPYDTWGYLWIPYEPIVVPQAPNLKTWALNMPELRPAKLGHPRNRMESSREGK